MPIEFRCSQCNQLLRVPDTTAGKSARCPKCQTMLQIPAAAAAPSDPLAPAGGSPAGGSTVGGSTVGGGAPLGGLPASSDPFGSPSGTVNNPFGSPPTKDPFGTAGGTSSNPFSNSPLTNAPLSPSGEGSNPFSGRGTSREGFQGGFAAPSKFETNPYAAPAPAAYSPTYESAYGPRSGLPWETKGKSLGTWWESAKLCMGSPGYAFSIMRQSGEFGGPMLYAALGLTLGRLGNLLLGTMLIGVLAALTGADVSGLAIQLPLQLLFGLFYVAFIVVIGSTIGPLITSGIMHLMLRWIGDIKCGFETTFRVYVFTQGSLGWIQFIPYLGVVIAGIWGIVMQIIGLSKAHEIDVGKVVLAFLLQIVVVMALSFVLSFVVFLVMMLFALVVGAAFSR